MRPEAGRRRALSSAGGGFFSLRVTPVDLDGVRWVVDAAEAVRLAGGGSCSKAPGSWSWVRLAPLQIFHSLSSILGLLLKDLFASPWFEPETSAKTKTSALTNFNNSR